jgi:hypothetical protein
MTEKNLKRRASSPGSRKRRSSAAPEAAAPKAVKPKPARTKRVQPKPEQPKLAAALMYAQPEALPPEASFHAALIDCAQDAAVQLSSVKHRSSQSAPKAVPLERPARRVLVRAWSWVLTKYTLLARKQPASEKLRASLGVRAVHAEKVVKPRRRAVSPSRQKASQPQRPGLTAPTSAFSWMHKKYTLSATKRLRVAESVSLGEKRFVALVSVEGREFLIGGGTQGMSLLADLGTGPRAAGASALGAAGVSE